MSPKRNLLVLAGASVLALVAPLPSPNAASSGCRVPPPEGGREAAEYPDHLLSPQESLEHHDAVFLGEVAVPTKKCSLGWCAGLKVVSRVKGDPGKATLVQVAAPEGGPCDPTTFTAKGQRWMVFANEGTSKTGYKYLQVEDEGPSFPTREVPSFEQLEGRFQLLRARLDRAIDERLGRLR